MSVLEIGWKEWISLPDLNIPAIKAKMDTGARTSALHAFNIKEFEKEAQRWVRFTVQPLRKKPDIEIQCVSNVLGMREIKNSGGNIENRYVIKTTVVLGKKIWPVEFTLTNREDMLFRILLGRMALKDNFKVDPGKKYIMGKAALKNMYNKAK